MLTSALPTITIFVPVAEKSCDLVSFLVGSIFNLKIRATLSLISECVDPESIKTSMGHFTNF